MFYVQLDDYQPYIQLPVYALRTPIKQSMLVFYIHYVSLLLVLPFQMIDSVDAPDIEYAQPSYPVWQTIPSHPVVLMPSLWLHIIHLKVKRIDEIHYCW